MLIVYKIIPFQRFNEPNESMLLIEAIVYLVGGFSIFGIYLEFCILILLFSCINNILKTSLGKSYDQMGWYLV